MSIWGRKHVWTLTRLRATPTSVRKNTATQNNTDVKDASKEGKYRNCMYYVDKKANVFAIYLKKQTKNEGKIKDFIGTCVSGVQERSAQYYNFRYELIISGDHHAGSKRSVYLQIRHCPPQNAQREKEAAKINTVIPVVFSQTFIRLRRPDTITSLNRRAASLPIDLCQFA